MSKLLLMVMLSAVMGFVYMIAEFIKRYGVFDLLVIFFILLCFYILIRVTNGVFKDHA